MKSPSYCKWSWPGSGVSIPSAKTTDLTLQAETLMQQIYCTIKPLYAGERPCPQSPESKHYHKVEAKNENHSMWRCNKNNRIQDLCCKYWTGISLYRLNKKTVVAYIPLTPVLWGNSKFNGWGWEVGVGWGIYVHFVCKNSSQALPKRPQGFQGGKDLRKELLPELDLVLPFQETKQEESD